MVKQVPVGTSDFKKIVEEFYFVDKSLFIKAVLDSKSEVFLFSRPRRFGKTSNISMLKYYFERTEEDTSILFKDLQIWQQGEAYKSEQGIYPVIFLTLKDVKCNTWEETFQRIKSVISEEYIRFKHIIRKDGMEKEEIEYFNRISGGIGSTVDFERSLSRLTGFLNKAYGEKPILLLDEYDIPVQQGYVAGFYQEVISFMRNWLSGGLKDNVDLRFAVLTGILRVAKESIFSGLNNLEVFTILDEPFRQYFGFTQKEVKKLAVDYECEEKLAEIKKWYDGYYFGNLDIYNPWSVLRYIKNSCRPEAYWLGTSSNDIIAQLLNETRLDTQEILKGLLDGEAYYATIDSNIVYPEIFQNENAIFSFLVMTGYLKAKRHYFNEVYYDYELRIPNKEIAIAYTSEIIRKLSTENRKFLSYTNDFIRAVYSGDAKKIDHLLQLIAEYSISYFDTSESFYHGWMLSMSGLFMDTHYVASNRETGEGRADLILEPKMEKYPGVIFEFKVLKEHESDKKPLAEKLKELAKTAYCQIEAKNYDAELRKRKVNVIYKYGVAFHRKTLSVYGGRDMK